MLSGASVDSAAEPILPDGSFEVVFHLGDPFVQVLDSGAARRQPRTLLVAELNAPVCVGPTGGVEVIGIRFRQGAAYRFFAPPLSQLAHAVHDLSDLWPGSASLLGRIGNCAQKAARIDMLDTFLLSLLHRTEEDHGFDGLMNAMRHSRGSVRVTMLAAAAGVSVRQLDRWFLRRVGVAPKGFARVLRFNSVVQAIRRDPATWLDDAMAAGYYDQAHLINEFRAFSGLTPLAFAQSILPLNAFFAGGGEMSDSSNPPPDGMA